MSWMESVIANKEFGKLTALRLVESNQVARMGIWECRCKCGELVRVHQYKLLSERASCKKCASPMAKLKAKPWAYKKSQLRLYKMNASKRKLCWELGDAQAIAITSANCVYCGGKGFGIDRRDNTVGYTEANSVPCCSICNYMKSDLSEQEFLAHIERVHVFQFSDSI